MYHHDYESLCKHASVRTSVLQNMLLTGHLKSNLLYLLYSLQHTVVVHLASYIWGKLRQLRLRGPHYLPRRRHVHRLLVS